jgi:hypothetical protein
VCGVTGNSPVTPSTDRKRIRRSSADLTSKEIALVAMLLSFLFIGSRRWGFGPLLQRAEGQFSWIHRPWAACRPSALGGRRQLVSDVGCFCSTRRWRGGVTNWCGCGSPRNHIVHHSQWADSTSNG